MIRELTTFFLKWEVAVPSKTTGTAQTKKGAPKTAFQEMAFLLFGDQKVDEMKMTTDVLAYMGKNSYNMLDVAFNNAV